MCVLTRAGSRVSLAESNKEKNELHCTNSANWRAAKQNLSIKTLNSTL